MNTNQIADGLGISWNTAETHLINLRKIGYVQAGKKGEIWYYKANY